MEAANDEIFGTTIISVAEQMKGWLAAINKEKQALRQVTVYRELARLCDFYSCYNIAQFNDAAANRLNDLRKAKLRVGTSDLRIAAIALTSDALLSTANRQDFVKIEGLRFADWLEP
ncbi:MAG: type II toxin-antitoxin system VapC family toxin [Planctomycetes bacterium]|nr:type II toxin-antitoxin system VapC family toxin [Planctomycetota bacterium]